MCSVATQNVQLSPCFSRVRFAHLLRGIAAQGCAVMPYIHAGVAHLVERHLAKVEVAGSSPVARSTKDCRSKFPLLLQSIW